jgi:hypothetical protein
MHAAVRQLDVIFFVWILQLGYFLLAATVQLINLVRHLPNLHCWRSKVCVGMQVDTHPQLGPFEALVVGGPVLWHNFATFVDRPLWLDIQWCHADARKLCDFAERKREGIPMDDVARSQFQKKLWMGQSAFIVSKAQGFVQVGNPVIFGDGRGWPLGAKFE